MKQQPVPAVSVGLAFGPEVEPVGRLAVHEGIIFFEYAEQFIQRGLEISPFNLKLQSSVQQCTAKPFDGLPGIFHDSIADGWGRRLVDQLLLTRKATSSPFSQLDRLAMVGSCGVGALVYEPATHKPETVEEISLEDIASATQKVFSADADDATVAMLQGMSGSACGVRPKVMLGAHMTTGELLVGTGELPPEFVPGMVKFASINDGIDIGAVEYVYSRMARAAGVEMEKTYLLPAKKSPGYFATKRFDRTPNGRVLVHSVSGLLHVEFRIPSLDYKDLLGLTMQLTKNINEMHKMYRLAVFNVLAHNRDDHTKNFSFLMDATGDWHLAPAYDLTFSSGFNSQQTSAVMGSGNPGTEELTKLGKEVGFEQKFIDEVIDQTRTALGKWNELATEYDVRPATRMLIAKNIKG